MNKSIKLFVSTFFYKLAKLLITIKELKKSSRQNVWINEYVDCSKMWTLTEKKNLFQFKVELKQNV